MYCIFIFASAWLMKWLRCYTIALTCHPATAPPQPLPPHPLPTSSSASPCAFVSL